MDLQQFAEQLVRLAKSIPTLIQKVEKTNERLNDIENLIYRYQNQDYLDQWVPMDTALKHLGWSYEKFHKLVKEGKVERIKIGRHVYITIEELKRLMDEHKIKRLQNKGSPRNDDQK